LNLVSKSKSAIESFARSELKSLSWVTGVSGPNWFLAIRVSELELLQLESEMRKIIDRKDVNFMLKNFSQK